MHRLYLKIADKLRMPYDPSPLRRDEVIRFLSARPPLSNEQWQCRFAPDIPLDFVSWFRDMCSKNFEFDLSAALPEDRLVEDLGMFDATFSDVDMDILEDFEARYHARIPDDGQPRITTLGQLLRKLWLHAQQGAARVVDSVELARKACELSAWEHWLPVGSLAAAFAETGDFTNAVKYQRITIKLLPDAKEAPHAEMKGRLDLYEVKIPYRFALPADMASPAPKPAPSQKGTNL
jgi:hypothetical protein